MSFLYPSSSKGFLLLLLTICSVVLISCGEEQAANSNEKQYFDLKGLIEKQIDYLDHTKPMVIKNAQLEGKQEKVISKDIDWQRELEAFIQADINRPSYAGNYEVVKKDSVSFEYKIKASVNLPVRWLRISERDSLMHINGLLFSANRIYESGKNIHLILRKTKNGWQLTSYSVDGYQKLAFMDKKTFRIASKLDYNRS